MRENEVALELLTCDNGKEFQSLSVVNITTF